METEIKADLDIAFVEIYQPTGFSNAEPPETHQTHRPRRLGLADHAQARRQAFMKALPALLSACLLLCGPLFSAERPSILWIVVDDMSAHFSCYGEKLIAPPAVDKLAAAAWARSTTAAVAAS